MAKKRGTSGICRIVAIDKPKGASSHDIVNKVRRAFDERRVGHTGTLDPLASGVLTICVGPATRLDAYLVDHDKVYQMDVVFGCSTTTDDAEGDMLNQDVPDQELFSPEFAEKAIQSLVGKSIQIPPAYSAIKVNGTKAYEAARKGAGVVLEARPFEVFEAQLDAVYSVFRKPGTDEFVSDEEPLQVVKPGIDEAVTSLPVWRMTLHVSKGTYMRAIARDLGDKLGVPAHCGELRRLAVGSLTINDCVTIEELRQNPNASIVDPLRLLGFRWSFIRDKDQQIANGGFLSERDIRLNEPIEGDMFDAACCTSSVFPSKEPARDGEVIGVCIGHELRALYEYQESKHRYKARCVFPQGVERGTGL